MKPIWKKGKGHLGGINPLLGSWQATSDSPMGKVKCTRVFKPILGGKYIELNATWSFGQKLYEEHALIGMHEGQLKFWSYTSDGKQSQGHLSDGSDVHPEAICFEAKMPAGIARMIYWPNADGSVSWAVESKNKKGWKRFTHHIYKAL